MAVLTAVPKGWFSWDFAVIEGAQTAAEISVGWWGENGVLTVGGVAYRAKGTGWVNSDYVMELDGQVLARATKSALSSSCIVLIADKRYALRRTSIFGRAFLFEENGVAVGSLAPEGILTRRAAVDLPESLTLPTRFFIVWLAVISWRQEAAASS